jgi:hypothetical protein
MAWSWGGSGGGAVAGFGTGAMLGGPIGAGVGTIIGGIGGGLMGGKKQSRDVADPLASLRAQLQALAGNIPGQVAKQKEINAERVGRLRSEGSQNIAENIRAERGFGNTSLQDELNRKMEADYLAKQNEADLAADQWGTTTTAEILKGTAGMYPSMTELPEEENWQANLLGMGANMAMQNWQQENQWKNMAKYFGGNNAKSPSYITSLSSKQNLLPIG